MAFAILSLAAAATVSTASAECRVMASAVTPGDVVDDTNTRTVECARTREAGKLVYDRHASVVRARTALADGEPIGRVWLPRRRAVAAGDRVRVTARLGAAMLSREVTALQSARSGERFFVTGADGEIFVAPSMHIAED